MKRIRVLKIIDKLGIIGIALWPFVFISNKRYLNDAYLINHEKIHLKQQIEMLIIPFYVVYIMNYIFLLFRNNSNDAYINIIFEREARHNETDLSYLRYRNFWSFLKYV